MAHQQWKFSPGASTDGIDLLGADEDIWAPPIIQKPVLLVADEMGACIPSSDSVFQVVVNPEYTWTRISEDIQAGKLNLNHRHIIIWCGMKQVQDSDALVATQELMDLTQVIASKNFAIKVHFSAVLPQPKNEHLLKERIALVNRRLQAAAKQLGATFLATDQIYLDHNGLIVRPIVNNYEDGLHLNLHGAHRLRKFWIKSLALAS